MAQSGALSARRLIFAEPARIFGRFLPGSLSFLSEPGQYRGAMVDAAPVEFQNTADLYDPAQTFWVSDDNNCGDEDEA